MADCKQIYPNYDQDQIMLISSRHKFNTLTASTVLAISGTPINQVSMMKSMGVLIDDITSHSLIDKLAKTIVSAIKQVTQFVPCSTAK